MNSVIIPNNWKPRSYQLPFFIYFALGGKRALLEWSRRHGKDDACLHLTAIELLHRVGTYWYMLPQYSQARKAIWDAVDAHSGVRRIDWAFPKEIRKSTNESEMKIVFRNGSVWQVCGSDNYDALVGSNPAGIVFSEYALSDPNSWDYLKPILEENNGWAVFNSTVRGQNHFTELAHFAKDAPDWFFSNVKASESVARVAGIDLARFGGDNNVIFIADRLADGSLAEVRVEAWAGTDAVFTQGKIAEVLFSCNVQQAAMDGDGVGGPIIDNVCALCDGRGIVFEEYHNTATAGAYANRTTQGYFDLAREANAGKVFLRDERVISELGARMYEFNQKGQVILQQKKEWRKESGKSPDFADAAVMASMIQPLPKDFYAKGGRPAFARTEYDVI